MAESAKSKRRIRSSVQTVREKAKSVPEASQKVSLRKQATSTALKPVKATGRGVARSFRPFRFLLWPFKTRPVRFIGRILAAIFFLRFFRGAWQELKSVVWPDRKQTTQLTIAVYVFAIIFGIIVSLTDYGLDKIFKKILIK